MSARSIVVVGTVAVTACAPRAGQQRRLPAPGPLPVVVTADQVVVEVPPGWDVTVGGDAEYHDPIVTLVPHGAVAAKPVVTIFATDGRDLSDDDLARWIGARVAGAAGVEAVAPASAERRGDGVVCAEVSTASGMFAACGRLAPAVDGQPALIWSIVEGLAADIYRGLGGLDFLAASAGHTSAPRVHRGRRWSD